MHALIEHVRTGRLGLSETVVFLHTGGSPALFAYDARTLGATLDARAEAGGR